MCHPKAVVTVTAAAVDPPPDPVPHLTRKLQMLSEALPHLYAELFPHVEE